MVTKLRFFKIKVPKSKRNFSLSVSLHFFSTSTFCSLILEKAGFLLITKKIRNPIKSIKKIVIPIRLSTIIPLLIIRSGKSSGSKE